MMMKKFFLYSLLGHFLYLSAMEHNFFVINTVDTETERVGILINQNHINKYQDSLWVVSKFYNFCDALSLTDQQIEDEMNAIESYIAADVDKECVLQKLAQNCWYVSYLMHILIEKKTAEFNTVTGSKIDELYNDFMNVFFHCADKSNVKNIVYKRIFEHFLHELDGIDTLDSIPQELRGIYFTILKGFDQVESSSLALSTNGKYVRATDHTRADVFWGSTILWDTTSGQVITNVEDLCNMKYRENIEWLPAKRDRDFLGYEQGKQYSVATQNYYAMVKSLPIIDMMQQSACIGHKTKVITLFKRPEMPLYFYQKAFDNSKNSLPELIALRDSKNLADITGFPQENLKQLIAKRIKQLTAETTK